MYVLDIKCSEDFLACAESSANLSAVSGVTYKMTQLINKMLCTKSALSRE